MSKQLKIVIGLLGALAVTAICFHLKIAEQQFRHRDIQHAWPPTLSTPRDE